MLVARSFRIVSAAVVLAGSFAASRAPAPPGGAGAPGDMPRTGSFQTDLPERSKSSAILPMTARLGWGTKAEVEAAAKKDGGEVDYRLSQETFEVFVPEDYRPDEPHGLVVWISPGPEGKPRQEWLDVLRKHKLIWVGPNNAGNNRTRWVRLGLAIDAAHNVQKMYKIDPHRVYVSGASGGGRCASTLAMTFPEVFTGGGFPIIGCNFYRVVEAGKGDDGRPRYFLRAFNRPPAKAFATVSKERRFVLLTGETDENRPQTELYADAMKKDGFRYVTYLQVPGMGHESPDAEWFEKGIVALDAGRDAVAKGANSAPEKKVSPATAGAAAKAPAQPSKNTASKPSDEEADKLMRLARLYLDNRMYKKAREKLNEIVKNHPGSAPVAEAKKLLRDIGSK